jgi:hypothetical protein
MKTKYYYDYLDNDTLGGGTFFADNDEKALERVKDFEGKLIVYKEKENGELIVIRKDN